MIAYVVIENTPGYLPDDLDPFVTTNRRDAEAHAADLARRLMDFLHEVAEEPEDRPRKSGSARDGYLYVDTARPHDLGRSITIQTLTGEDAREALAGMEE